MRGSNAGAEPRPGPVGANTAGSIKGWAEQTRLAPSGLTIREGLAFAAWSSIGQRILMVSNGSAWWLGDWLVYGRQTYGERYKAAIAATSLDYGTLRNYASVASRFELSRRRDNLSFHHHVEVASLPDPAQDLWLWRAEDQGWSRNELRRRLAAERRRRTQVPLALKLEIRASDARQLRWSKAAAAAHQTLADWFASLADAATDAERLAPAALEATAPIVSVRDRAVVGGTAAPKPSWPTVVA